MVQGGRFAGRRIRAFAASAGGGYTLNQVAEAAPWPAPRPRLRGDKDPATDKPGTFNPDSFPSVRLFQRNRPDELANLAALRSSLGVASRKDVSLEASYTVHRRWTGADATYLQPLVPLPPAGGDRLHDVERRLSVGRRLAGEPQP
ncbi:alginate export family protein [Caulobacter segnis]